MNILYIGQHTPGTTSKMRADQLKSIIKPCVFNVIDIHLPFYQTNRIWRSFGFRYNRGPLVWRINKYIKTQISNLNSQHKVKITGSQYDLIWLDKAVFITSTTTELLRGLTIRLVHFTPDMAFFSNSSLNFEKGLKLYDYVITTKSLEKEEYLKLISKEKLIVTTQGFDSNIHKLVVPFSQKKNTVAFIGLCEPFRESVIQKLINNKISVKLAGKGWVGFVKKNKSNLFLNFYGESLFSERYTQFIASAKFGIGLLSKKFPELHTTRTFEIPACGTALLTESNSETTTFFKEDEAIFYDTTDDLISRVIYLMNHPMELKVITTKCHKKVTNGGFDYESILKKILNQVGLL